MDIRARVSGYLVKMPFKEGAEVKEGELLFEVDPRPYQAQYDQADGQVNLYKAQLELAKANYARDQEVAKTPGAVSIQQLDQDKAAVDEADAAVKAFQASLEVYKLNLSFTKVTSPIDGQVSRYYLTLGNLVVQDQTLLDHGRLAGSDVRLFRRRRGHGAARAAGDQRGHDQALSRRARSPSSWRLQGEDGLSRTREPSISSTTR